MTTSIGAEGLDFHFYCNWLAHYTKPSGVIALEQKNGRIDRHRSLAVRRWWAEAGNQFGLACGRLEQMKAATGGLTPDWDSGEGNLHCYFFYTRFIREKDELESLFDEQTKYRGAIGSAHSNGIDTVNLCTYLKKQE